MKLSKLITYKQMVDVMSAKHLNDEIFSLLKQIRNDLDIQNIDFDNIKEKITKNGDLILTKLEEIDHDLEIFKSKLTEFVDGIKQPYYEKSRWIYDEGTKDTAEYILDRHGFKKLLYQQETLDFFISRVKMHASWKWPAMELRPAFGEITDSIIACDPLYLVDTDSELFKHVKTKWTPEFQRRIRYYTINEQDRKLFHQLPHGQMGLILAVDFFNFRPVELIRKYLASFFSMLRPGGTAIFTYNNCDYPIGVDNFESSYYCYTPGREIKSICEELGFRVVASFDLENNVSWLEIQKRGALSSFRGGQTLGKIINI